MVCVGSVSLEFVLTKSDSDSENNAQHEKCWSLRSTAYPPLPSFTELYDKLAGPYREKQNNPLQLTSETAMLQKNKNDNANMSNPKILNA